MVSLLLTIVTYHLPFMSNQKIDLGPITMPSPPDEIVELQKKKELSEDEFQRLIEYSEESLNRRIESRRNFDIHDEAIITAIRENRKSAKEDAIYWVVIIWVLFFVFLPKSIFEFVLSIIFPSLYFVVGLLLGIEFLAIVGLAITVFVIKRGVTNKPAETE